ncbi:MAG: hypothetical protein OXU69_09060 [Gemmatimonadota bacterium]|nr:hypothetical protein [Gemmatimonadota bacterium]MDE2984843.1 hypothetical protein [Gemmatimonadota bacterium]
MKNIVEPIREFIAGGVPAALLAATLLAACENPQPPGVCGTIPEQTVVVGETASVNPCFNDPNGDVLKYSMANSDPGVAAASISGTLVTVRGVAPGVGVVTITATDASGLAADQEFRVVVPPSGTGFEDGGSAPPPNQPPQVIPVPSWNWLWSDPVVEDFTLEAIVADHFFDPDDDYADLTVTAHSTDPAVVRIESADTSAVELLTVSPGRASVTMTVTDPDGASASKTWKVWVGNVAPEVWSEGRDFVVGVDEETMRYFPAFIVDCNIGDSLTYTLSNSNPAVVEARIEERTAHFRGLAAGTAEITMAGEDRAGLTAEVSFTITVAENRAPVIVDTLPDEIAAIKGDTLEFVLTDYFADPDGDDLSYGVVSQRGLDTWIEGDTLWVEANATGYKLIMIDAVDPHGRMAWQFSIVAVEDAEEGAELALSTGTGGRPDHGPRVAASADPAHSGPRARLVPGQVPPRRPGTAVVDSG